MAAQLNGFPACTNICTCLGERQAVQGQSMIGKTACLAALAVIAAPLPALAQLNVPARIVHSTRQIDLASDGTATIAAHVETKILNQTGVSVLGQTKITYREMLEELEIKQAYTLKPDGQKIMVRPEAIIVQQAPAPQNAPQMDDSKQKVIIYPSVEIGDVLVLDTVTKVKPVLAGGYMYDTLFPAALAIDDANITVSAPRAMALAVENRMLEVANGGDRDRQTLTLHYEHAQADLNPKGQSPFDIAPRLSLSTFKTYDALASAYAREALPAMEVTPAIQAKADQITQGAKDRRGQAHKIYDWVSAHVRYVALEFGRGGIIPHTADSVLVNGYGDCKDHAVLFAAMLRAKGIAANLVILNGSDVHTLAKVPTIAPFNHMITWLPEFHLYADTTAGKVTPFGFLPEPEYGKPVMHIDDHSGALHQTPLNDAHNSSVTYKQTVVSDEAGHIVSNSEFSAKGDFVMPLRMLGQVAQGQDSAKLAEAILKKSNTPRATGTLTLPTDDFGASDSYNVVASYSTPGAIHSLVEGTNVGLQDNLRPLSPFSTAFFGPLISDKAADTPAGSCFNGHASDEETLQFPASRKLVKLPADTKLSSSHIDYISHWTSDAGSVTVHRELTTHFEQNFCTGPARAEMASLMERLKDDLNTTFSIPRIEAEAEKPSP
jgi:transglutaminase-like putative cysteine protease